MDNQVLETFKYHVELTEKIFATKAAFVKNLVFSASAVLAIIVTFHQVYNRSTVLYYLALGALTLSILGGIAALYLQLVELRITNKHFEDNINERLALGYYNNNPKRIHVHTLSKPCELICILSFVASVISLVLYAVVKP